MLVVKETTNNANNWELQYADMVTTIKVIIIGIISLAIIIIFTFKIIIIGITKVVIIPVTIKIIIGIFRGNDKTLESSDNELSSK